MITEIYILTIKIAEKKIYPEAQVMITDKQNVPVKQYLTIYREMLDLMQDNLVDWSEVTEIILVDEASLSRVSDHIHKLTDDNVKITVYDHYLKKENYVKIYGCII